MEYYFWMYCQYMKIHIYMHNTRLRICHMLLESMF